jgi:hypothetical protein
MARLARLMMGLHGSRCPRLLAATMALFLRRMSNRAQPWKPENKRCMTCPYPGEDDPTVYVRRLAGISRYNCANGVSFDQLIPHTPRPSIEFVPSYVDLVEISNRSARP